MDKGRNSVWADFGPRPGAVNQAQWPKRPDGPRRSTRSVHAQRAITALGTGAAARLLALGTAMMWGAVMVESTSRAGPPRRVRWPVAELTGVMQRHGGEEGAST
jgi:hypothetical protein